jgi:hypothetical protein
VTFNVIDEFTRECLAVEVDRSIDADGVVAVLDRLALERGCPPACVRMDSGPELAGQCFLEVVDHHVECGDDCLDIVRDRRRRMAGASPG